MSRQEGAPRPTVRRATALPQVTGGSGPVPALAPRAGAGAAPLPGPGDSETTENTETTETTDSTENTDSAESPEPKEKGPGGAPVVPHGGSASAPATAEPATAPVPAAEPAGSASAATAPGAPDSRAEPEQRGEEAGAATARAAAEGAPAEPSAGVAESGEPPSGRPNRPLLAAAAIAGTVLIAVPFLLLGGNGDEKRTESSAASRLSSDTVLGDDDATRQRPGGYAPASPSTSPKPKKSKTPAAGGVPQTVVRSSAPAAPASAKAPAKSPKPAKTRAKTVRALSSTGGVLPTSANFATVTGVLLKNTMTGLCADVPNYGKGKLNGPVNQFYCDRSSNDNQRWDLLVSQKGAGPGGADLFTIRNTKDGYCVDLPDYGAKPSGTGVYEWHCNPGAVDNQMWYLDERSSGQFWIRNYSSGNRCLDVSGYYGVGGRDAHLTLFDCNIKDDHLWSFS
ncbi:RICIN domain-containing protein [Streptomyces sp. NPDC006923]|uniref:RICIN domain-containing protein n=1 Tax=Streptomyces sp. NPDC006923 TaxID=3155355 RepID=UPI0034073AC7